MSGNVHSNPGPQMSHRGSRHSSKSSSRPTRNKVTSLPDWISNLSQSSRRSLMHIKNLQRKLIKAELHSDFLQKYKNNGVIPPGLQLKKQAQIKSLRGKFSKLWKNSLDSTSHVLIDLLISQHNTDIKTIKEQLETTKSNFKCFNDITDNEQLVTCWLRNDKNSYYHYPYKQKEKKFNFHLKGNNPTTSYDPSHKSKSTNHHCQTNYSENLSHQRGQSSISDSEGETSTSHNPTIHIIPGPQSATNNNKKRKRRFHKGGKTKSRQIQTDLVVNLSNYELTEHEIAVLSKGLRFIPIILIYSMDTNMWSILFFYKAQLHICLYLILSTIPNILK